MYSILSNGGICDSDEQRVSEGAAVDFAAVLYKAADAASGSLA